MRVIDAGRVVAVLLERPCGQARTGDEPALVGLGDCAEGLFVVSVGLLTWEGEGERLTHPSSNAWSRRTIVPSLTSRWPVLRAAKGMSTRYTCTRHGLTEKTSDGCDGRGGDGGFDAGGDDGDDCCCGWDLDFVRFASFDDFDRSGFWSSPEIRPARASTLMFAAGLFMATVPDDTLRTLNSSSPIISLGDGKRVSSSWFSSPDSETLWRLFIVLHDESPLLRFSVGWRCGGCC